MSRIRPASDHDQWLQELPALNHVWHCRSEPEGRELGQTVHCGGGWDGDPAPRCAVGQCFQRGRLRTLPLERRQEVPPCVAYVICVHTYHIAGFPFIYSESHVPCCRLASGSGLCRVCQARPWRLLRAFLAGPAGRWRSELGALVRV